MGPKLGIYHWPPVYISWGRKKWASGRTLTTSLLFAFPETGDRWAPAETFTIRLLFALRNGGNNRNRVNSQALSPVDALR